MAAALAGRQPRVREQLREVLRGQRRHLPCLHAHACALPPLPAPVRTCPRPKSTHTHRCPRQVRCRPSVVIDGYNETIDRREGICRDPEKSVVIRATDNCPCKYADNEYSNRRWCCHDHGLQHFDMSLWAFEKASQQRRACLRFGVPGTAHIQCLAAGRLADSPARPPCSLAAGGANLRLQGQQHRDHRGVLEARALQLPAAAREAGASSGQADPRCAPCARHGACAAQPQSIGCVPRAEAHASGAALAGRGLPLWVALPVSEYRAPLRPAGEPVPKDAKRQEEFPWVRRGDPEGRRQGESPAGRSLIRGGTCSERAPLLPPPARQDGRGFAVASCPSAPPCCWPTMQVPPKRRTTTSQRRPTAAASLTPPSSARAAGATCPTRTLGSATRCARARG